ncbi:MAG: YdiU family protein [Myxococcales bacterium]|nr:YdiU family protein [Myxococcales bacterium]
MTDSTEYEAAPRHAALGGDFFDVVAPASFPEHHLRYRNDRWAARVGLQSLDGEAWLDHFGRFAPLPNNFDQPLSLRYHGHQFRTYNPDLGDGRGFLFAQLRDAADGRLLDLATKGSGQTPWSRGGDGRLTLKGGVREVLATALLEALGVYTSKSFSLVETGEELTRGDEPSPTRSSVLVRLSHSHIRFGTFQRQAYLQESANIQKLVDYSVEHYLPALQVDAAKLPVPESLAGSFLHNVVESSADLAASWMVAGFVHGVLNTDNLNITGESFDYGPYRFLPTLDPRFTAAYFDSGGLYAYGRQPEAVGWNLMRLAESLLTIEEKEPLEQALSTFQRKFNRAYCERTLVRLGLRPVPGVDDSLPGVDDSSPGVDDSSPSVDDSSPGVDDSLPSVDDSAEGEDSPQLEFVTAIYDFLYESQIGFEQFFFDWFAGEASADRASRSPAAEKYAGKSFAALRKRFEKYQPIDPESLTHAYFSREHPCTLLIDEIESLWDSIAEADDWSGFEAKLSQIEEMRSALAIRD